MRVPAPGPGQAFRIIMIGGTPPPPQAEAGDRRRDGPAAAAVPGRHWGFVTGHHERHSRDRRRHGHSCD